MYHMHMCMLHVHVHVCLIVLLKYWEFLFQNVKVNEWMEKMNTEFSEIEGFELSIEDNA